MAGVPSRWQWRSRLLAAIAVVALLVFAVLAWPRGTVPAPSVPSVPPPGDEGEPPAAPTLDAVQPSISGFEDVLDGANHFAERISRADWDVDAKAETLAPGMEPAFALVRDSIGFDAYAGVLRGASGTYTERSGNAADRALLLASLLSRQGVVTRFAFGTLSEENRDRVFERIFHRPEGHAGPSPLDGTGVAFHERVASRARRDYTAARGALGDRLGKVTSPTRAEVLAALSPHVWVQAQLNGRWVDLDPTLADAVAGVTIASLERTDEQIPEDLFQRVRVHIYAEHLRGDSLVVTSLLDHTARTVDLVDKLVFVTHTSGPLNPMGGLGMALGRAFGNARDTPWTPLLWIEGEMHFGTPLALPADGGPLVAEWLEVELQWPDGRRESTRRALLERAGQVWRATTPLAVRQLRPLEGDETGPFAMTAIHNLWLSAGRHNLADLADALDELAVRSLTAGADTPNQEPAEFGDIVWPFALEGLTWMVWTDHVVIPALNVTPGIRLFADGPRVSIFTRQRTSGGGVLVVGDLRRDALRGVVDEPSKAHLLAESKLRFGLLQGALEHEAGAQMAALAGLDPSAVQSTSAQFADAQSVVLSSGSPDAASITGADPESLARLQYALAAGATVVVPTRAVDSSGAWWEIDSGTGDVHAVVGQALNGMHVVLPPYMTNTLRDLPKVRTYQGAGTASIDTAAAERRALTELMKRNQAAKLARLRAQIKPPAFRPPPPGSVGGSEESTLLSTVAVPASLIIGSAFQGFVIVYELLFWMGLFHQYLD